jgi:16S rRNA (adenine1518-N6/adenine1519-N6)-dimethyltransferase
MKIREIKKLFKKHNLFPSKRLGQNFLVDKGVLQKIIEAAQLKPGDIVLEIGPGIGNLTLELAKRVRKVITIEKDKKMCKILQDLLECWNVGNVEIIESDILKTNIQNLISNIKYKVVANLPYYIVSPVIRKFLELPEAQPLAMILMVQKEVAQRICAKPPEMNLLAVSVQFYAQPKIIAYVSKNSFFPQPRVDSAIIKISKIKNQKLKINRDLFFKIVRAGFSQPRKQLINNLAKGLKIDKKKVKNWLLKNGVKPEQRAETLSIEDWIDLTKNYKTPLEIFS